MIEHRPIIQAIIAREQNAQRVAELLITIDSLTTTVNCLVEVLRQVNPFTRR